MSLINEGEQAMKDRITLFSKGGDFDPSVVSRQLPETKPGEPLNVAVGAGFSHAGAERGEQISSRIAKHWWERNR